MEGRREVVKPKNPAENEVHVQKVHVCLLLSNRERGRSKRGRLQKHATQRAQILKKFKIALRD